MLPGAAMLIGFAALLAVNQVMVKVVNTGLQPVFFAGLRSAIAMLCLLVWFRLQGPSAEVAPEARGAAVVMGLIFSAEFLLLFLALDLTTVVRTSIIFYSMPVWLALMAHFGLPGERITPAARRSGWLCAFAGTAWAIADSGSKAGEASLAGDLCALGAATAGRARPLWRAARRWCANGPTCSFCGWWPSRPRSCWLLSPAFGPLIRDLAPLHLWLLLFQSVVVVAAGFMFWLWLLTIYPAAGVASFSFLTPILGLGFGWMMLNEPVGPGILGAGALVAAGIRADQSPPRRCSRATLPTLRGRSPAGPRWSGFRARVEFQARSERFRPTACRMQDFLRQHDAVPGSGVALNHPGRECVNAARRQVQDFSSRRIFRLQAARITTV